jgi:hypothetical protein
LRGASVLGIVGYRAGARLYPQPYEQFPFDFFLIPMGLLVGFLAAGITRLAARDWGAGAARVSGASLRFSPAEDHQRARPEGAGGA